MSRFMQAMKKHPAIIPVVIITFCGAGFAGTTILRSANYYTDVSFRRSANPYPFENVKPHQNFKFIQPHDYSKVKQGERPDYTK